MLYQHREEEISRRCLGVNASLETLRFSGTRRIRAAPTCTFSTPSFIFDGQLDLVATATHVTSRVLNVSSVWTSVSGFAMDSMKELADELFLLGSQVSMTMEDATHKISSSRRTSMFKWSFVGIGIFVLLFSIIFSIIVFRYRRIFRMLFHWRAGHPPLPRPTGLAEDFHSLQVPPLKTPPEPLYSV